MADEITLKPYLKLLKGNHTQTISPTAYTVDQTGIGAWHSVQNIGTSEESITSFGDVGTEGWCYMRNLDTTNYVQWGPATTVYVGRLEAGETAEFRMEPGASLFLKANTASCSVEIFVAED
jgi:hypothetical protein